MWFASEIGWLWSGLAGYAASTAAVGYCALKRQTPNRPMLIPLAVGVALVAAAIAVRWVRAGHGPFLTMFEILLSNLFSLGLIYLLVYWWTDRVRWGAVVALPILLVIGLWSVSVSPDIRQLPATYDNYWLWIHVGFGKLFLGVCLVAVGVAGFLLLCRAGLLPTRAERDTVLLDALLWRFLTLAFVFHSFMLIAGAVWAQDAWGRYWNWDPLETWSLVTWLLMGLSLHLKVTYRIPDWSGWLMVIGVFVVAFLTFLGVPFVSQAPHKGIL